MILESGGQEASELHWIQVAYYLSVLMKTHKLQNKLGQRFAQRNDTLIINLI